MNDDRRESDAKLEDLGQECLARIASEGPDALESVCRAHPEHAARLREVVAALGGAGLLDAPEAEVAMPERIGRYRILTELGAGGMGTVYLAEQTEPVRRQVALKVVKLGMDTKQVLARFEAERQALAVMDHSCIARVLDAGATEHGRPFFVMDYVEGEPITDYCDRNGLRVDGRLALFQQVCSGVQHAHQKGIIHRDLKPWNVLVTNEDGRPRVKIIDFGLARATDQGQSEGTLFTQQGQLIGTPEYMSPEQAGAAPDIDTRTDVYSLGVILYELLAGRLPFSSDDLRQAGLAEIQRVIREEEPKPPSTCVAESGSPRPSIRVRGDLDWITLKALEKERSRRYQTASELAADVQRYLSDEAVTASPPSFGYRLRKFARRNRLQVTAGAIVLVALLVGAVGMTLFALDARAATRQAQLQLARSEMIALDQAAFLTFTSFEEAMVPTIDVVAKHEADGLPVLRAGTSLRDPWGQPYRIEAAAQAGWVARSSGPDRLADTADDLEQADPVLAQRAVAHLVSKARGRAWLLHKRLIDGLFYGKPIPERLETEFPKSGVDPWRRPMVYEEDERTLTVRSAGPDGTRGTEDDVTVGGPKAAESMSPDDVRKNRSRGQQVVLCARRLQHVAAGMTVVRLRPLFVQLPNRVDMVAQDGETVLMKGPIAAVAQALDELDRIDK